MINYLAHTTDQNSTICCTVNGILGGCFIEIVHFDKIIYESPNKIPFWQANDIFAAWRSSKME